MLSHCKSPGHHRVATTAQNPQPMLQQSARHSSTRLHAQLFRDLRAYASAAGQAPQQLDTTAAGVQQQEQQSRQQQLQQQWFQQSSVYYSNYPLDRAPERRKDESQLLQWFNAPNTRVTPILGSKILVSPPKTTTSTTTSSSSTGAKYTPIWVSPAAELGAALDPRIPPLFLGLDTSNNNTPHFAVQVTKDSAESLASSHAAHWVAARSAGPDMSRSDAALMAVAAGLAQWNLDTQYHGASGAPTLPQAGGFSRSCSASGRSVYPRIDPAIITLVTCGPDWCLLGRKADWPQGRYSTLAGFLEIGESLEQALCREVLEESGVAVGLHSTRYVTSQPWPFPRSLMVGFYAEAAAAAAADGPQPAAGAAVTGAAGADVGVGGDMEWLSHQGRMAMMHTGLTMAEVSGAVSGLRLQQPAAQEDEMEDVRWFHRDWLRAQLRQGPAVAAAAGGSVLHDKFHIPGEYSLAYRLINTWLDNSSSSNSSPNSNNGNNGSSSSSSGWIGDQVPDVDIAQNVFKYVLLRLTDATDRSRSKLLVRGHPAAAYHNHILQHTKGEVSKLGAEALHVDVLGGGRIEHYPDQGVVSVYGYSAAFGPAVHEVVAGLLKKAYPFHTISWSYEGY